MWLGIVARASRDAKLWQSTGCHNEAGIDGQVGELMETMGYTLEKSGCIGLPSVASAISIGERLVIARTCREGAASSWGKEG